MKHCDFGVMNIASQLLMLNTLAPTAVSTVGTNMQAATHTVSIIFMDLLGNEPTIGHIHVPPFR